jgi:hypothetical protein
LLVAGRSSNTLCAGILGPKWQAPRPLRHRLCLKQGHPLHICYEIVSHNQTNNFRSKLVVGSNSHMSSPQVRLLKLRTCSVTCFIRSSNHWSATSIIQAFRPYKPLEILGYKGTTAYLYKSTMSKRHERSMSHEDGLKHRSTKRAKQIDAHPPLDELLEKVNKQKEDPNSGNVLH